ncbi:MAG: DUF309 domain-containing protein [Epsilonproteobacteria bacterium]|nr:DUF309 domain-containing protein [Campylobacterota bacterium]
MEGIDKFLEVVEKDEFVEGHEVLEDKWRELKKNPNTLNESKILKGLINGSTALALKNLGKEKGAKTVWDTFEKYRPLIHSEICKNSSDYKLAEKLLDEKYKLYMQDL